MLSLLLILLVWSVTTNGWDDMRYSPFNCGDMVWPIKMNNSAESAKHFSDWLLHWQFDCGAKNIVDRVAHVGGIGSSFMFGSKYFMEILELKAVYRPKHGFQSPWLWADPNPANCTLGLQSYDCFSEPISDCGVRYADQREPALVAELARISASMDKNPLKNIHNELMDVCTFARLLEKPVKFVHGLMMEYMMRPLPAVMRIVNERKREVFADLPRGTVSIGFQVRSGPMQDYRAPFTNLTEVMAILDARVRDIEQVTKHKVGMVFLCSDLPDKTYQSAHYMNTAYPRSYVFRTTHAFSLGDGEQELLLRAASPDAKLGATRFDMFVDFMTDVEILTSVDYLIGSKSNVYMIAAAQRMARNEKLYSRPRSTCHVDKYFHPDDAMICEGTETHKATWRYYFNPEYTQFEAFPPF